MRSSSARQRRTDDALLLVPIGFVCDHVEILYDIDILAQKVAQERGLLLRRTASLNTLPTFIEALASVVTPICKQLVDEAVRHKDQEMRG